MPHVVDGRAHVKEASLAVKLLPQIAVEPHAVRRRVISTDGERALVLNAQEVAREQDVLVADALPRHELTG